MIDDWSVLIQGERNLGIVSSGIAYQYAREVFPEASFLKLAMTWPLPRKMITDWVFNNLFNLKGIDSADCQSLLIVPFDSSVIGY